MTIDPHTFNRNAVFHGTKGLVRIGDKIVVIRRDLSAPHSALQIDLPGGGREGNESPFETFQREIREELNILIQMEDILYSVCYTNLRNQNQDTFFMVTRRLDIDEKNIIFGDKGLMYYCMTIHEFLESPDGVAKQKRRIVDYLEQVKNELT